MKELAKDFVADDVNYSDTDQLSRSADNLTIIITASEMQTESTEMDGAIASDTSLESSSADEKHLNHSNSPEDDKESTGSENEAKRVSGADSGKTANGVIAVPKKKNRLISSDSGFGSYGRFEVYSTGSIDSVAVLASAPTHTTSVHTKPISKHDVSAVGAEADDTVGPLSVSKEAAASFDVRRGAPKNRNTTSMGSFDTALNFVIDSRLINRCDGFKEVQCYFDENGSPKVREKVRTRRKSTLRQELKARSLGASYEDATLRQLHQSKTPSCISFTRLCKKFKETFRSKCHSNAPHSFIRS